jgi:hypothetical protein
MPQRAQRRMVRTIRGCRVSKSAVEPVTALHAKAVATQVVVAAVAADEAAWRIGLQPAFVLPPVPDTVLGPEHPPPAFAVQHREISHRDSERAWLHVARAPFFDQELVSDLSFREWIDCHAGEYGALIA